MSESDITIRSQFSRITTLRCATLRRARPFSASFSASFFDATERASYC